MSFLELAKKRRSCRKYAEQSVPEEALERCLEVARLAPSACNSQPWKFIVVQDPVLRNQLAEKAFSGIYAMNQFARQAPALVVVIREDSKPAAQVGQMIQGTQYNLIDLGIACEHFVLQAEEEGLGTCFLGWFDAKQTKKVLSIPKRKKVDLIISVGYALKKPDTEKVRKELEQIREIR
ncbi:MAG: nitroreductase family protein [Candidatus Omnitrophica bacterium]|nr:nitroreductase family protein [Candidatus Omnitrophota bacterium]